MTNFLKEIFQYLLEKDSYGYFKLYSFFAFDNFKYFYFYLDIIGQVFLKMCEENKEEIQSELNKNKIFFLNVCQILYGFEDTCSLVPSVVNQNLEAVSSFIPIMTQFLSEFNLLHIYAYCNIEEFLLESDEKIWEEMDGLSRTYSYKTGGVLVSITNILFFALSGSIDSEENALKILKSIGMLIFHNGKPQSFEKKLCSLYENPIYDKLKKMIESINYFSGKKNSFNENFATVNIEKIFLLKNCFFLVLHLENF